MMLRLEVFHQDAPDRRVLVSIPDDATLDDLNRAIHDRLGVLPTRICLGESQAQVLSVYDIQGGDLLRVVFPLLDGGDGDRSDGGGGRDGSAAAASEREAALGERPPWYRLVHTLVTVAIFVVMERLFQRHVYMPYFRAVDDDVEDAGGGGTMEFRA